MKRNSERGVALVITLIMLALVTFMTVVFLAVSRREKASVGVTADIVSARLMTDAALARAQSEIASRMLASGNPFDYDLIVSTNYYNPNGFTANNTNAANVNYERMQGGGAMGARDLVNWAQNIANLQYEARAPVFIATNLTGLRTNDFRFFVDLNRNGMFEPTGWLPTGRGEGGGGASNYFVGDPQWIGVLERPDQPHGENNRFIGRYAFAILPSGRSLDLNYLHNDAKRIRPDLSQSGYLRNQGVGSWEINFAGFLAALNTNNQAWGPLSFAYNYNTTPGVPSSGVAFEDASSVLKHRYERTSASLAPAKAFFYLPNPLNTFTTNGIDYYSDGPLAPGSAPDDVNRPWAGSFNTNGFYDIQELFDPLKTSAGFVQRLTNRAGIANASAYDRYTFYRLLAQLGTESRVPESNKVYFADFQQHYTNRMHLFYQNTVPNGQTNLALWSPLAFFTGAADRMLRATIDPVVLTNGNRRDTNFMFGLTPVRQEFCCTNIQIYNTRAGMLDASVRFNTTNNEYTAATHRMFQLAANIHDATTVRRVPGSTNDYPSVFRPTFGRTATNLFINGFVEENNTAFLATNFWVTPEQAMRRVDLDRCNVYGVPLVIGAKKGYPNFNKLVVQTVAEVSRRVEIRRPNISAPPNITNQMYLLNVTNRIGMEAWNSYATTFNRNLELRVTNQMVFALSNRLEGTANIALPLTNTAWAFGTSITLKSWPGWTNQSAQTSFVIPVDTNVVTLPLSAYLTRSGKLVPVTTNAFDNDYRVPHWFLRLTNRVQYIVIDRDVNPNRIIDFVNLDNLIADVDLSRGMVGETNAGGGGIFSDSNTRGGPRPGGPMLTVGDMWNPRRPPNGPSIGVQNQIGVATGQPYAGEGTWRDSNGQLGDKQAAIDEFTLFMKGQKTNLTWQVPFTPSLRLYQRSSWEANDPLVHYTVEDLTDPVTVLSTNLQVRSIPFTFDYHKDALLADLNPRYRPWGGNPRKDPANDATAYAVTMKDPLVWRSDDWHFSTNQFANLGWLGRVHRGTPWQTMYLKSAVDAAGKAVELKDWGLWSGNFGTHPTNDWRLFDLFTVAPNDNASRGLLAVNQTNLASWSAVLSGVTALTNTTVDGAVGPSKAPHYDPFVITPNSPQMRYIVEGISRTRARQTNAVFKTLGDVLAAPELTVLSPYLNNRSSRQLQAGVDDAAYERIPQQILSLLKTDEPRVVVYAFGQALKPAERSLVTVSTVSPPVFNLCTNYQVTGEFAAKAVLRLEELPPERVSKDSLAPLARKLRAIMESYTVLQAD